METLKTKKVSIVFDEINIILILCKGVFSLEKSFIFAVCNTFSNTKQYF